MNISIRFVCGKAWDSRVIEYSTRCPFSHVEALTSKDTAFGAMLNGGVTFRSLGSPVYKNVSNFQIWKVPCSKDQHDAFHAFLFEQWGRPYDWRAILSFGLGERDWRSTDSWFCSELQAAALEAAGMIRLPRELPTTRITPRDVYMLISQIPGAHKKKAA